MVRGALCFLIFVQLALPAAQPLVDHVEATHQVRGKNGVLAYTTHAPQHPLAPTNPFWFIARTPQGAHPWMAGTIARPLPDGVLEIVAWVTPAAHAIDLGAEPTWLPGFRQLSGGPQAKIICDLGNVVTLPPGRYVADFAEVTPENQDSELILLPTGRYHFQWNFTITPDGEHLRPETFAPRRPPSPPPTPIACPAILRRN